MRFSTNQDTPSFSANSAFGISLLVQKYHLSSFIGPTKDLGTNDVFLHSPSNKVVQGPVLKSANTDKHKKNS